MGKLKPRKIVGRKPKNNDEGKPVDEQSVADKVTEAIASGEIDNSRVVKDDEDEKESVIEKDQIEEMETCHAEEEENQVPVPDIAEKMAVLQEQNNIEAENEKQEARPMPAPLELEKE